jgi:hypothetical protein
LSIPVTLIGMFKLPVKPQEEKALSPMYVIVLGRVKEPVKPVH